MSYPVTELTWDDTTRLLQKVSREIIKRQAVLDKTEIRDDHVLRHLRSQCLKLHQVRINLNVQRLDNERSQKVIARMLEEANEKCPVWESTLSPRLQG